VDTFVFLAVLFAAACHAIWNALIKVGTDPLASAAVIAMGAAAVALSCLPVAGVPAKASWPWLIGSVVIHLGYFIALIESYRVGELGQVYPLARGSAPLLTAALSAALVGERLTLRGWGGVATLVAGVLVLSLRGGREVVHLDRRSVGYALLTGLTICAYSVVDGIGARLSGNPLAYVAYLLLCSAAVLVSYALWRDRCGVTATLTRWWMRGLIGGALQALSYGIVLWAMTRAPIAIVAALRETSVLFAAAIAVLALREQLRAVRLGAAALIVCGLILIRLQ
jgi:drug/metabolite transporter (DMT)-like permease